VCTSRLAPAMLVIRQHAVQHALVLRDHVSTPCGSRQADIACTTYIRLLHMQCQQAASPSQGPQARRRALLRFAADARLPCLVHDSRRCAGVCLRSDDATAFAGDQLTPLRMMVMTRPLSWLVASDDVTPSSIRSAMLASLLATFRR